MTIDFKIPNGSMRINVDTFFREGHRLQIRKMLKGFRDSEPAAESVHEIKDWLQEEINNATHQKKDFSVKYSHEKEQLPILEKYQDYLKNFCTDKDKMKEAKKAVRNCKTRMRAALSGMGKAEKLVERYKFILEDTCKILG